MTQLSSVSEDLLAKVALKSEVEDFLFLEARLLDERRLEDWLELLDDEIHYYMPIRRNVKFGDWETELSDPESEISYFDEGKDILRGRVRQLNTGVHWAEEPVSRFEHLVSNVEVTGTQGELIEVASKFFCYQNRLADEVNIFVGRRYDLLRRDPETSFKLVKRTILLAQNVLLAKVINTFF